MNNYVFHNPRAKAINMDNKYKLFAEMNNVVLMCPECLHMIKSTIAFTNVINLQYEIENFISVNNYYGVCPNCKEDVKFELLDINIAQIIKVLNDKGYYTIFSCEGHIEPDVYTGEEGFAVPYIYFYNWNDSQILKDHPLPDTWYIPSDEKACEIFLIRGAKLINYFDNEEEYKAYMDYAKNEWDKEKSLRDIYNWAVSLPDKSQEEKQLFDYFKSHKGLILAENANRTIIHSNS